MKTEFPVKSTSGENKNKVLMTFVPSENQSIYLNLSAKKHGVSKSKIIRYALDQFINKYPFTGKKRGPKPKKSKVVEVANVVNN